MGARKYNTLGNILYIIDRKGNLYLERGKVKRSTTEYHYELMLNTGGYWYSAGSRFNARTEAMARVKVMAGITN